MEDAHSRAYGLAHQEILTGLITVLIRDNLLNPDDIRLALERAGQTLLSMGTDVAAAASEHVREMGTKVGVSR